MDIGVWMSKETLAHKREGDVAAQVWNLPHLPDGFMSDELGRLFVAVDGHWRGFFQLVTGTTHNPAERDCPCTVVFDPASWTPVLPERAPHEAKRLGYTLVVPSVDLIAPGKTKRPNEQQVGDLISILKREEKQE
jgi:hypothetical protein